MLCRLLTPLPIDSVQLSFVLEEATESVLCYAQVFATAKTGVEMEAIAAVQGGLLTIWDLCKGTEPALSIDDIRLLVKVGGKSGVWKNPQGVPGFIEAQLPNPLPLQDIKAAVVVASDRAHKGIYEDKSGAYLVKALRRNGAKTAAALLVPDEKTMIQSAIQNFVDMDIILLTGGTGIGPRDVTPDSIEALGAKPILGIGEFLRRNSEHITPYAVISRLGGYKLNDTLIFTLPGSLGGVKDNFNLLLPLFLHMRHMIEGKSH